jgi:hypothetical protein
MEMFEREAKQATVGIQEDWGTRERAVFFLVFLERQLLSLLLSFFLPLRR